MEHVDEREKNFLVIYMLSSIFVFCIGYKILGLIFDPLPRQYTSRMMEALMIIMAILFDKFTPVNIHIVGLKTNKTDLKRTLIRGSVISIFIIIAFVIAKIIMSHFDPEVAARPMFALYFDTPSRYYYPLVVIFQECLSRTILQENVKRLVGEKNLTFTILICSMVFSIYHLGYSLLYMIAAFILGGLTAYIYEKDHSIWGCVIIHFVIGYLPKCMGLA